MPVEIEFAHLDHVAHACFTQRLRDEVGGAVARADRALDGGGQAGFCPISGKHKIAPGGLRRPAAGLLRRRGGERRAPLATICHGGSRGRQAVTLADLRPDRLRQFLARRIDQPVAGADGDREPAGKREHPLHRAVDDAEDRRLLRPAARCGNAR